MYIYPDNLTGKATLFLWSLQDIVVIGTRVESADFSFALAQLKFMVRSFSPPLMPLNIRFAEILFFVF